MLSYGNSRFSGAMKFALGAGALFAGASLANSSNVFASEALPPPQYPWEHKKMWKSFDHAALRRGHQVFAEVCSSCHGLNLVAYRTLVGVTHTEDEVKEIAAEIEVIDGVDDDGEPVEREGKLTDFIPSPYANDNEARSMNNGALPPDLSLIVKARPGAEDYIMALLTGYRAAPHGVVQREGLHYNPYFAGGFIGMAQALQEGAVEYEDGTEPTITQMAKDVTQFLAWCAEPEHDDRKKTGLKVLTMLALFAVPAFYWKRFTWSVIKTKKVQYHFPASSKPLHRN